MNITELAIRNNRLTITILVTVLVAGILTFRTMPRDEDPGFIIRTAVVLTYMPGASPERIEQLLTDRIEKAVQQMPEIDFISSQSKTGTSVVYVNIQESYTDMAPIWESLRRKIDDVKESLPEGIRGPFVNDEFGDVFGTIITITGEGFDYAELKDVADQVRDEMLYIPEGFAHGFLTLQDSTEVFYQMSQFYEPEYARGVRWNDPAFNIAWPAEISVISEKDKHYSNYSA